MKHTAASTACEAGGATGPSSDIRQAGVADAPVSIP